MAVIIKTPKEIKLIREAGQRLALVVAATVEKVAPGVTKQELDQFAETMIRDMGDEPAFLGYQPDGAGHPFPCTLCISINEEVVHGLSSDRVLVEGDVITIDCGIKHEGVFADHAITVGVGKISDKVQKLLNATREALRIGIAAAKPGGYVGDIGAAVEKFVDGRYGIVRDLAGHGVGREIHEDPFVPNYGKVGTGAELKPGMIIAIEPMLNMGTHNVILQDDGYTFITADKKLSAHFEHTVLIGKNGPEILTEVS